MTITPNERPATWRESAAVFALALAVYLPLGGYILQSIDTDAASTPAWSVAQRGSVDLSGLGLPENRWYFDTADGTYSNRFPGTVLYSTPLYLVARAVGMDDPWAPGVAAAALVTAAAVALVFGLLTRLNLDRGAALWATAFFAFGTATWSVSADAQWPHSMNQLLITAGLLALALGRVGLAGLLVGLTVAVRPQLAPAVLTLGVLTAVHQKSVKDLVRFGAPALVGLGLLVGYHAAVLGVWSVNNGQVVTDSEGLIDLPRNIAGTLVDPARGVLFLYPAVIIAALGIRTAWKTSPCWTRAATSAGVVALLTQLILNRYYGGDTFFGSRITIESLTLAYPLLVLAFVHAPARARRIGKWMLVWSVVLHTFGAIWFPYGAAELISLPAALIAAVTLALVGFWVLSRLGARFASVNSNETSCPRPP